MKTDHIYCENCLVTMGRMPNEYVDLVITSPPYDNFRKYEGYSFDFREIVKELHRVLKPGAVVIWVVADSSIGGGESLSSFKQAIGFCEVGFTLNDTMIYAKPNRRPRQYRAHRYEQIFEYMFVFVKGSKSNVFNPLEEPCINSGKTIKFTSRDARKANAFTAGGKITTTKTTIVKSTKRKGNIWEYANNSTGIDHPAVFPESLVRDHIITWSNPGDLIYDPFMGSGTTAKISAAHNRIYIGSEVSQHYCEVAAARLKP